MTFIIQCKLLYQDRVDEENNTDVSQMYKEMKTSQRSQIMLS